MKKTDKHKSEYGFKSEENKIFPPMVFAEITNVCNLKCIHCPYPQISQKESYKPLYMDFNIYKKIVDEVSGFKSVILRLVCDGEPMLHPDFLKMIIYAKRKKISPLCFNTNGTLLDEQASREILHHGVDAVEISLDALNKDTYEYIRNGASFDQVMSNVHRFIRLRNELNSKTKIMVSIIDQPEASHEIKEFVSYWAHKVDRVITRAYTSIGGLVDPDKMKTTNNRDRWPCPLLWTRAFVNVDGLIKFCVEDWFDETVIGDIRYETLRYVWSSDKYQRLRDHHLSNAFDKIQHCTSCVDWPARQWHYDYFYALNKVLKTSR
jgi:sulfatase maturation enzyme AslB (radical SAM superfamily)